MNSPFNSVLQGFDPYSICNTCLPQTKIPEWFSHRSRGSSETIQLPPNLYDDSNWMGLVLVPLFLSRSIRLSHLLIWIPTFLTTLFVSWIPIKVDWNLSISIVLLKKDSHGSIYVDSSGCRIYRAGH